MIDRKRMNDDRQEVDRIHQRSGDKKPATQKVYQRHQHHTRCKERREPMREFHLLWIYPAHVHPATPKIDDLFKKLSESSSPLMIDIGITDEQYMKAQVAHAYAELDILRKPRELEAARYLKDPARNTHVETPGLEPAHVLFATANATC